MRLATWILTSLVFSFLFPALAVETEEAIFKSSLQNFTSEKYEESSKLLTELVKRNPRKALYWFNLGNAAFMAKKYPQAYKSYQNVIKLRGHLLNPARLYQAKSLRMMGQNDSATLSLQKLLQENPTKGIRDEAESELVTLTNQRALEVQAMRYYQGERYEETEKILRRPGEENLSVEGRLLLAMTKLKLDKPREAELLLGRMRSTLLLTEKQKQVIKQLQDEIKKEPASGQPFHLMLDVSHGTANNLYYEGKSVSPVSAPLTRIVAGAEYQLASKSSVTAKVGYLFNDENPHGWSDLRSTTHTIQVPVLYENSSKDFSVTPYYQQQGLNMETISNRMGAMANASFFNDVNEFGADLNIFSQKAISTDYEYLSGSSYYIKPYFGVWTESTYFHLAWFYGSDGTQDITYTDGSRLPLRNAYQGPALRFFWRLTSKLYTSVNVSMLGKNYLNSSLPGEIARKDTTTEYLIKLNYSFTKAWSVYGQAESVINKSTLGSTDVSDKNYEVKVFTFGITWDVF